MPFGFLHPGLQRGLLAILFAIVGALLFAALPGASLPSMAKDAALVKHVRTEIATLHALRAGFQQVQAEPTMLSGRSARVRKLANSLDGMAAGRPESEHVATLQDALAAYTWTVTRGVAVERYADQTTRPLRVTRP